MEVEQTKALLASSLWSGSFSASAHCFWLPSDNCGRGGGEVAERWERMGGREGVRVQLKVLCILLSSKGYTNYLTLKQP